MGYVIALIISYILLIHSIEIYFNDVNLFLNRTKPDLLGIMMFVFDQFAKGILFDLLESYKIGFTSLEYEGGLNLFSTSIFVFRFSISLSFFSTLFFAYRWYKIRIKRV
jgi:hypothetical protein